MCPFPIFMLGPQAAGLWPAVSCLGHAPNQLFASSTPSASSHSRVFSVQRCDV